MSKRTSLKCSSNSHLRRVHLCGLVQCALCDSPHECRDAFPDCPSAYCLSSLLNLGNTDSAQNFIIDASEIVDSGTNPNGLSLDAIFDLLLAQQKQIQYCQARVEKFTYAIELGFQAAKRNYTKAKQQLAELGAHECRPGTEYYPQLQLFDKFITQEMERVTAALECRRNNYELLMTDYNAVDYACQLVSAYKTVRTAQPQAAPEEILNEILGSLTVHSVNPSGLFSLFFRPKPEKFFYAFYEFASIVTNLCYTEYELLRYTRFSPYDKQFTLSAKHFYAMRDHNVDNAITPTYGFARALLDTGLAPCALSHDFFATRIPLNITHFKDSFEKIPQVFFPLQNIRAHEWACRIEDQGEFVMGTAMRTLFEHPLHGSKVWRIKDGSESKSSSDVKSDTTPHQERKDMSVADVCTELQNIIDENKDVMAVNLLSCIYQLNILTGVKTQDKVKPLVEANFDPKRNSYHVLIRRYIGITNPTSVRSVNQETQKVYERLGHRSIGAAISNYALPYQAGSSTDHNIASAQLTRASSPDLEEPFPRAGITLKTVSGAYEFKVSDEPILSCGIARGVRQIRLWRAALAGLGTAAYELAKVFRSTIAVTGAQEAFCWFMHALFENQAVADLVQMLKSPTVSIPVYPKLPHTYLGSNAANQNPIMLAHYLDMKADVVFPTVQDFVTDYTAAEVSKKAVIHPLSHLNTEISCVLALLNLSSEADHHRTAILTNPGVSTRAAEELVYDGCLLTVKESVLSRALAFESGKQREEDGGMVEMTPCGNTLVDEIRQAAMCYAYAATESDTRALYRYMQLYSFFATRACGVSQADVWSSIRSLKPAPRAAPCLELAMLSVAVEVTKMQDAFIAPPEDALRIKTVWADLMAKSSSQSAELGFGMRPHMIRLAMLSRLERVTEADIMKFAATLYFASCKYLARNQIRLRCDTHGVKFVHPFTSSTSTNPFYALQSPGGARYMGLLSSPPQPYVAPTSRVRTVPQNASLEVRAREDERNFMYPVLSSVIDYSTKVSWSKRTAMPLVSLRRHEVTDHWEKFDKLLLEHKDKVAELVPGYRTLIANLAEAVRSSDFIARPPSSNPQSDISVLTVFEEYASTERQRLEVKSQDIPLAQLAPIPGLILAQLDMQAIRSGPYHFAELNAATLTFEERIAILEQGLALGCPLATRRLFSLLALTSQVLYELGESKTVVSRHVFALPGATDTTDDVIAPRVTSTSSADLRDVIADYLEQSSATENPKAYLEELIDRMNMAAKQLSIDLSDDRNTVSNYLSLVRK